MDQANPPAPSKESFMDALIPLVALVSLASFGFLAIRFGADSRPTIRSDEHRLALAGMVWDAGARPTSPAADSLPTPPVADDPLVRHVVWAPTLAAPAGHPAPPFPTLLALDGARDPGQFPFATDPDAARLEQRARRLIDQHWSERVWLTGRIDQARLDLVCDALERERQSLQRQHIDVVVVSDHPTPIAS